MSDFTDSRVCEAHGEEGCRPLRTLTRLFCITAETMESDLQYYIPCFNRVKQKDNSYTNEWKLIGERTGIRDVTYKEV